MSIQRISDPRIRVVPSVDLETFIATLSGEPEVPENVLKFMKRNTKNKQIFSDEIPATTYTKVEQQLLADMNRDATKFDQVGVEYLIEDGELVDTTLIDDDAKTLTLDDLKWLNQVLVERRRKDSKFNVFLHELLAESKMILPKNEIEPRNPQLEARCVKLREQQAQWEYKKMTKGVDNSRRRLPEDTISYQMKQLNSQLIAVAQFIFSVLAGFAFGFIGIELLIGDLDFGFRLLLGIIIALIIALAEIYFLAKKLNEDDTITDSLKKDGVPLPENKFKFE